MTDDELFVDGVSVGALPECTEPLAYDENLVATTPLRPDSGSTSGWPLALDAHGADADGLYVGVSSGRRRFRLDPCPDIWLWRERGTPPQGYALNCAGVETVTGDGMPYLEGGTSYTFRVPTDRSTPVRAVTLVGAGESRLQLTY